MASQKSEKKYMMIIGASSMNIGSLNMLFSTVSELERRFPEKKAVVVSNYEYRKMLQNPETRDYKFEVLPDYLLDYAPFPFRGVKMITNLLGIGTRSGKEADKAARFKEVIQNAAVCIDISGYSLHSDTGHQMNSVRYCASVAVFKKQGIPMYLFPQSFGPFHYRGIYSPLMNALLKYYMPYPRRIFCREKEGIENFRPYRLKNVQGGYDTVLMASSPRAEDIYSKDHTVKDIEVERTKGMSISIIPSTIVYHRNGIESSQRIYDKMLDELAQVADVYVIAHSVLDKPVCEEMRCRYIENGGSAVHWIMDDLDPIEMERLLAKFDMCITSRFHGALHCYKHGVPCVVFGWSTKYGELMELFGQEKYFVDTRKDDCEKMVLQMTRELMDRLDEERVEINKGFVADAGNVFDIFEEDMRSCTE